MKFTIPIQRKIYKNGNTKKEKKYMDIDIDVTLASQIRFETKFPELAKNEDLYSYSQRIQNIKEISIGKILSQLKLLYCWIDIELEFIDFLKLFDMTDIDYVNELTNSLKNAFEVIFNSSAEKN